MSGYEDDIAALRELDDEEFIQAVADAFDVEEDWRLMLDAAVVARTVSALGTLQVAVQRQLSQLHDRIHALPHGSQRAAAEIKRSLARLYARDRELGLRRSQASQAHRDANRERNAADLAEGKRRRQELQASHAQQMQRNAEVSRDALRRLTLAIQRHRLAVVGSDLAPEVQDRELWAALDEVKVPLGPGMATLTEMLGRGIWTEDPS